MKNINWNNVGWASLKTFSILILNTPLFVFILGSIIGNGNYYQLDDNGNAIIDTMKEIKWFAELELKEQAILVGFCFVGILISIALIKFFIVEKKQDKRVKEQTKELKDEKRFKNL